MFGCDSDFSLFFECRGDDRDCDGCGDAGGDDERRMGVMEMLNMRIMRMAWVKTRRVISSNDHEDGYGYGDEHDADNDDGSDRMILVGSTSFRIRS